VTLSLRPGRTATPSDLLWAQAQERALEAELPAVRTLAAAWRNGLGALLAAVVGFGLVKGRSDITQLAPPWNAWAGVLLLLSLLCGAVAAFFLLRAATGMPALRATARARPGLTWAHSEALASLTALRRGVFLFFACVSLLVGAVGVTWYGPASDKPRLRVVTDGPPLCGSIVRLSGGVLTLRTSAGDIDVDLRWASGMQIVDRC
jgi:hypothetical protein